MKSSLLVITLLLLASSLQAQDRIDSMTAASAPAPRIFERECAPCHAPGATATRMLEKRRGEGNGALTGRSDLAAEYIRTVVRNGLNSMVPMSRIEVTDGDLEAIINLLTE